MFLFSFDPRRETQIINQWLGRAWEGAIDFLLSRISFHPVKFSHLKCTVAAKLILDLAQILEMAQNNS